MTVKLTGLCLNMIPSDLINLLDFGLSRSADSGLYEATTNRPMPIKWMAPESIKYGNFTSSTDTWSFGVG